MAVKEFLGAYHLSENNRLEDQNLPVTEDSWFWRNMESPLRIPLILEAYNLGENEISEQRQLIDKKILQKGSKYDN